MQTAVISSQRALDQLLDDLRLDERALSDGCQILVACVLRRVAGILCPCATSALTNAARRSLEHLPELIEHFESPLEDVLEASLEGLMTGGDLIELSRVAITESEGKHTWLFTAPPSFVERDCRAYVFGVAPDDAAFLPTALFERLRYDGALRFIESAPPNDVGSTLKALGLRVIKSDAWLAVQKVESAQNVVSKMTDRLQRQGTKGDLNDVSLLGHAGSNYVPYSRRWKPPSDETGFYIVRTPQVYGAPLWSFAELSNGRVLKALRLPFDDSSVRACDVAWRVQLAIDAAAGHPATYTVKPEGVDFSLSANFPLPLAAKRRLLFLGGRSSANAGSRFTFRLSSSQQAREERFLRDHYWLKAAHDSKDQNG